MKVAEAKAQARRFVVEEASRTPGFVGALLHGSAAWLDGDATLPPTSDVDVLVVVADEAPKPRSGKRLEGGVLLDVSYLPRDLVGSAEQVLERYELAGSFWRPGILADPSGALTRLRGDVTRVYARRDQVHRRCGQARAKALQYLDAVRAVEHLHDRVITWAFGTGLATHVLLVAGLRNPTVRRRYAAARELLAEHGRLDFHESLLAALGSAELGRARAERHLGPMAEAFDAAGDVIRTPLPFASDLGAAARSIAIEGTREGIEAGLHREGVFWMVVTLARCRTVFHHDAPELLARFDPALRSLLADLGIASDADLGARAVAARAQLEQAVEVAEDLIAANAEIEG